MNEGTGIRLRGPRREALREREVADERMVRELLYGRSARRIEATVRAAK